jgi:peptidoglycan/xylan/chitin deacetylase (PgdA/CDA1 family)
VHVVRRIPIRTMPCRLARPIASITFDDFPKSAWRRGGRILADHRAFATYYVAGSLANTTCGGVEFYDRNDLVEVHAAGHEIGAHTYAHRDVRSFSIRELLADAERNDEFVGGVVGDVSLATFAYPYGSVTLRSKLKLGQRFACCRGTEPGINRGLLDLGQLAVVSLESRSWDPTRIDRWIADACRSPSWSIFYTHDIADAPTEYGCTPAMLNETLTKLRKAGIEILTVKNGLARACFGVDSHETKGGLSIER